MVDALSALGLAVGLAFGVGPRPAVGRGAAVGRCEKLRVPLEGQVT